MTPGRTFRGGRSLARLRALVPALGLLLAAAAAGTALTRGPDPFAAAPSAADTVPVFGPRRFESGRGRAALHVERFRAPAASGKAFLLRVTPESAGEVRATVRLNGATVLSAALSGGRPAQLPVALLPDNVVEVSVEGPAGSAVRLALLQAPEATFDVFGPRAFTRGTGAPKAETARFVLPPGAGPPFRLHLANGEADGSARVSSAIIRLNGVQVSGPSDLSQNVGALLRDVALAAENTLEVELRGAPGGKLTLRVTATDAVPPTIEIAAPAPGSITRKAQVEVSGTVMDAIPTRVSVNGVEAERTGVAFRAVVPLTAEGENALVVTAVDAAGNRADSVRTVVRDSEAPVLAVDEPVDGATTAEPRVTVRGTVRDRTAVQVSVGGAPAALDASGSFVAVAPLAEGENFVTVAATDAAGNGTTVALRVTRRTDDGGLPPDPATVAPPPEPGVTTTVGASTAFLYTGPNPVQTGVAPGAIPPLRASVVRGRVTARDGGPLGGVEVRVLGHPELGRTRTRADGVFDLAVSGGGILTLVYEKEGWLPADRKVSTRWQEFAHADDVALVALDPAATTVDFGPGAPEAQVARATVATDADGPRQATLVFDAGTEAALEMPDGSLRPAESLTIRATEYTVGENGRAAMPAELPAMSGYTYAVELSADEAMAAGAPHVRFSRPVAFYLDNFLSFPVGLPVPAGWYDRERGIWVPTDDGRVIRITAVDGGRAGVDVDGDGAPEEAAALEAMGIDDAERARLAELYAPGKTLWRVQTDHFSWIDLNYPRGAKEARDPRVRRPRVARPGDDPCLRGGSIIECEGRVLGERLPLVGTGYTLGYRSDRAPGRVAGRAAEIPVSGPELPSTLRAIVVEVRVAGRVFSDTLPPDPDQTHTFVWDGLDAYGRTLQGQHAAEVRVGYVYPTYYLVPPDAARSFGLTCLPPAGGEYYQACEIPATVSSGARREETRWQVSTVSLGATGDWDARAQSLGGWTLDVHHAYDPAGRVLYGGDGSRRSAASLTHVLETVAGGPGAAADAPPLVPSGMVMAPDGSVYIASYATHQVWRWHRDGRFTLVAGSGGYGCWGDGGPATAAGLAYPDGVALGPDGSLYIEDSSNDRIRRVAPDGTLSTFAGAGQCAAAEPPPAAMSAMSMRVAGAGAGADTVPPKRRARAVAEAADGARVAAAAVPALGDGGPADQALLSSPYGVDVAKDGSVYIADSGHNRIRRVTPDGIITTVAGTGAYGFSGDGGAAALARLGGAWGVTVGPDGSLYISDTGNNRVRRVGVDGVISTVAGDGGYGFSGDGGPAPRARLRSPADRLAFGADGSVYIPDSDNGRIRRVTPDGVISTVAGSDDYCAAWRADCGDGGPATAAAMGYMYDLMNGPDGELYIADTGAGRLRRLRPAVPGFAASEITVASEDGLALHHFDAGGRHLRTVSALTGTVLHAFGYDAAGRLATITDREGRVTRVERDAAGAPSAIVGPFGDRTLLAADPAGWLARVENPAREATLLAHTPDGLLVRLEDPAGHVHAFGYDALGRLARDDDGAGGVQTLAEAGSGEAEGVERVTGGGRSTRFVTEALPTGDRARVVYDAAGLATRTLRETAERVTTLLPDGTTLRTELGGDPRFGMQSPLLRASILTTPAGRTLATAASRELFLFEGKPLYQLDRTWLNGRESTLLHDVEGRTLVRTSAEGRAASFRLDSLGRLVEVAAAGAAPAVYRYDAEGRLAGVRAGGREWTYGYEGALLSSVRDPAGRTARFDHDAAGRLIRQRWADGTEVAYGYDAAGELVSVTPAGRGAWRFARDGAGRVTRSSAPPVDGDSAVTAIAYDADGLVERIIRADGAEVAYAYDGAGRVRTMTMPTGTVRYAYGEATGRLDSVSAPSGTLALAWDGPLALSSTWTGAVAGSVSWSYDDDLRVSAERVGGAHEVQLRYDGDGLLTGAGELTLLRDATSGRLAGTTLGAVATGVAYDDHGAPSLVRATAGGAAVLEEAFVRDSLGRITAVTESGGGAPVAWGYGYDAAGRLAEVTRDGAPFASYGYDANGNRVRVAGPAGAADAEHDAQDRLVRQGGVEYGWTRDGELRFRAAGADTLWLDYDAQGALAAARLAGGTRVEYVVDGAGRRIGKRVDGALVQGFLYGRGLNPVAELDGGGAVVSRFVYGSRPGVPDYMVRDGRTYALVADARGSVRRVVDAATGEVAQAVDYGPWGEVLRDTRPGFQPFGFAGGLADGHTGLLRLGARDYDPGAGRWTARDPLGFAGRDANLYAYVHGDPVNQVDATGKIPVPVIVAGVWGLVELGLSAADALSFAQTVADPCASGWEKAGSGGFFLMGVIGPGGGGGAAFRYTPDQQALQQLIKEGTRNGKRQLDHNEAQTVLDWADEVGYPGAHAFPSDVASTNNHWRGGPHIHVPNTVNGGHVPVAPGFVPRP